MISTIDKDSIIKKFDDPNFKFYEDSHSYYYGNTRYPSVSNVVDLFVKGFNGEYWSFKKAKERWIDNYSESNNVHRYEITDDVIKKNLPQVFELKKVILQEWEDNKNIACELGTAVHNWIEKFLKGLNPALPSDEKILIRVQGWIKVFNERLCKLDNIAHELKIFSNELEIAGTIDSVFGFKGMPVIGDWKTNREFKTDEDRCYGNLLYPFKSCKENELNKYSIQLSLYRIILEDNGIESHYPFMCHIGPNGIVTIHQAKDFRAELRKFLKNKSVAVLCGMV